MNERNNIVVYNDKGEMVALIYLDEYEVATQTGYSVAFMTDEEIDELMDELDELEELEDETLYN